MYNFSPVSKKNFMRQFAYKNTYNEAIFDLRHAKKKIYVKSSIPDMIPEKTYYWLQIL